MKHKTSIMGGAVVAGLLSLGALAADLPALVIDKSQVSVSGISSGAYMAGQMHVAHSATFARGVGIVAGGPFYCAQGSLSTAATKCMAAQTYGSPDLTSIQSTVSSWQSSGAIDATSNLANTRVYLFTGGRTDSGTHDTTVNWRDMDSAQTFYQSYTGSANIQYKSDLAAEHSMPTLNYGNACSSKTDPYLTNCGYDAAGELLKWIYGSLNNPNTGTLTGQFVQFDQSSYLADPTSHGMSAQGWAYVPASCSSRSKACRLHVVFHGCKQYPGYTYSSGSGTVTYGDTFVKNAGYNRWADSNDIVLLYPQANALTSSNPNGCWDWWGYDDANYARKTGRQVAAVKAMVDQLSSGSLSSSIAAPTGLAASSIGETSVALSWNAVSGAASYTVYRNGSRVGQPASTTYGDNGLAAGTRYDYVVHAVDGAGGEGAGSSALTVTTAGSKPVCYTSSNYAHVSAGRATTSLGYVYAKGSGQNMGLYNTYTSTTLKQTASNYYVIGSCS